MIHRRNTTVGGMLDALEREGQNVSMAKARLGTNMDTLDLPVRWNGRMTTTAGRAGFDFGLPAGIDLNKRLITEGIEHLRQTFLHELAHLLAGVDQGHGPVWQAEITGIGGLARRCHQYASLKAARRPRGRQARHPVAECSRCGHMLNRTRALPEGRVYKHVGCGGVFKPL